MKSPSSFDQSQKRKENQLHVVALAGGVGGARLASGLAQVLPIDQLTVIVNVGDDFEHLGLMICPDLDTVTYTLAGLANPVTGWGRAGETWQALETVATLGGPTWFRLGDQDLGLHLERTRRLKAGQSLSQITSAFCRALRIAVRVLPASDDRLPTWVNTQEYGQISFQEYFVQRQCRPQVTGFHFAGANTASPAPGVIEVLKNADLVVICPSNPWVSVDPILAIPGIREGLAGQNIVAVSPIIAGQTVKGPAAKMYSELGIDPSPLAVASHYGKLLKWFVFDQQDAHLENAIQDLGVTTLITDTIMRDVAARKRLAQEILEFVKKG
jgi:LPPG:FO 2-phospho-L-lactate transferase